MLPNWLKQLAATCTEQERQQLLDKINEQNPSRAHPQAQEEQQAKGAGASDGDDTSGKGG